MITHIPAGQKQLFNNQNAHRDPGQLDQRYQQLMSDRNL